MVFIGCNRKIKLGLALLLCSSLIFPINAQVTRGQLLRLFYKASSYHNNGNSDKASETYREIATFAPQYPDTYLRMAEVYDKMGDVESAIVMYRKYINLEMDDAKIKEPAKRLKTLEEELGVTHYEEAEEKQIMTLFAKYDVVQSNTQSSITKKTSSSGSLQLFAQEGNGMGESPKTSTSGKTDVSVEDDTKQEVSESSTVDYALPVKTDVEQGLSLFSLSALVETRNEFVQSDGNQNNGEQSEDSIDCIKDAPIDVSVGIAGIESGLNAQHMNGEGLIAEEKIVLDPNFLDRARAQVANDNLDKQNAEDFCTAPLLTYVKKDRLSLYGLDPATAIGRLDAETNVDNLESILAGKWVSSECNSNGRETWMFEISQFGGTWSVSLDNLSGIYNSDGDNVISDSWHAIKSMWVYDHAISSQIKELRTNSVNAQIQNGRVSFSFVSEHQYKPNENIYNWSRNILTGISGFVPFGGVVSKVGNSVLNYVSEKDQQKTYTTTLEFTLRPVTSNALRCEYVIYERERSSLGEKEIYKERKACTFYKTEFSYKGFEFVPDGETNLLNKKLYALLKEDSKTDNSKLYPLACMEYYGAGTKRSISKAVGIMQELAEKKNCQRAKAWLIPVCYNLSLDEQAYPLRAVRKHFRSYTDGLLDELMQEQYPYAYSLQADIYVSNGTHLENVLPLYTKAAKLGDVYALYKLGMMYAEGQIEEKDGTKAVYYFTQAAQKGYADAYLQLALLHRAGKLVDKDYQKYTEYLFKAVNDGSISALKELSEAYSLGLGVRQSFDIANQIKMYYMQAAGDEWKEVLNVYGYNTLL